MKILRPNPRPSQLETPEEGLSNPSAQQTLQVAIIRTKMACPLLYFFFFMATPAAYGSSQARGRIGAITVGLRHSHGHARSEPCLRPTPQLTAMPNP